MIFQVGMIVEHPIKPEWGPGKVVAVHGDKVHIVFRDLPDREAKIIQTNIVSLIESTNQNDPILDNLPPLSEEKGKYVLPRKRITVTQAIDMFLKYFPLGFEDPGYMAKRGTGERIYKLEAHQKWVDTLGNGQAKSLLETDNISELSQRTKSVISKVNLLSPFENMAFSDALKHHESAKIFFTDLIFLLEAPEINRPNFEPYANCVCNLPQEAGKSRVATWPVATILPFLAQPERHMFLKPGVTQTAAETLGFDLHYNATPNWTTYEALLRMGHIYKEQIKHLAPRDFIDVQSFIWVTCGGYGKGN
jgi:hypothetical protein